MFLKNLTCLGWLLLAFWSHAGLADPQSELDQVRSNISVLLPGVSIDSVRKSPIPGLYEVTIGPRLAYVTLDGRYLIQGDLIDLELRKSLTTPRLRQLKLDAVEALGEENMLIYEPDQPSHTVTVFTDIDCAFCRKLHKDIEGYLSWGIRIRYLFYPRAGHNSASYLKAVSVWCAEDPKAVLTEAKKGKKVEGVYCKHPIQAHMKLADQIGVSSAPVLLLDSGELLPSYLPPEELAEVLKARKGDDKVHIGRYRDDSSE